MEQLRIAVLNAAHRDENTTRNFRRELDASLAEFDATDGEVPDGFDYDGAVVTGSRSSVYWDDEWMQPIKEWVGDAIDRGIPFLGVCWGHQLLADVLGGTVADMWSLIACYRSPGPVSGPQTIARFVASLPGRARESVVDALGSGPSATTEAEHAAD